MNERARAKPERAGLLAVGASLLLIASVHAAPGGYLVEAISDECDTLSPIWSAGLRGIPESLTVTGGALSIRSFDNGDDPYPSAEDMISAHANQLGRSLSAAEGPSVIAQVWLPPFEEWSNGVNASGFRKWLGVRVTAYDADLPLGDGYFYPGIYFSTDDAGPCLIARVGDGYGADITIGRISAPGWWTVGLSWNEEGRTEYYATPGRASLTSAELLHVTPKFDEPAANRSIDALVGNFVALRMTFPPTGQLSPNWIMDNFRVYVRTPPVFPTIMLRLSDGLVRLELSGGSEGFRYLLQRSDDLTTWITVDDLISDGQGRVWTETAAARAFYRIARPWP